MKNLQYLATEVFRVKNNISLIIMNKVFNFQENENYNLRSGIHLVSRDMHTAHFNTDTISWAINNCRFRLCKIFTKDFGLVEVCHSL